MSLGGDVGGPNSSATQTKPKKAEKATPVDAAAKKKAERVVATQRQEADGDVESRKPEWDEPKGTLHTDQFNTRFPGEQKIRQ